MNQHEIIFIVCITMSIASIVITIIDATTSR